MKVIIPLAGFGTRLRPHTFTKPKPLINVAGKPVLGHLLDKISGLDIDEYIFVVGYLGDQVQEYVKSEYKLNARFVEQNELLGQATAIWLASVCSITTDSGPNAFGSVLCTSSAPSTKPPTAIGITASERVSGRSLSPLYIGSAPVSAATRD